MERCSVRELGIKIGKFPTGPFNNITDVEGIRVGHTTLIQNSDIRTGVTIIKPSEKIFYNKFLANSFVLNGAGEVSGLTQLTEWGLLETPIALTNTMGVGEVSNAVVKWMSQKYEKIWNSRDVVIPIVGECDDSFLHNTVSFPLKNNDVIQAIMNAKSGKIEQGSVGAGTGMICCDFKAGIGSSSRVIEVEGIKYTIGMLVLSNFGHMEDLRVDGFPIGRILSQKQGNYKRRVDNYGSIIAIMATDLPVSPHQLQRLCKRAALGIGRVGSYAAHGSGEIIVGFSTANIIKHGPNKPHYKLNLILDEYISHAYQGVIEATEEAILNSLSYSNEMTGIHDNYVPGINLKDLKDLYQKFNLTETELAKYFV